MFRTVAVFIVFLVAVLLISLPAGTQPAPEAAYVGNSQCKICHNKKDEGEPWNKWKAEKHSKALELLSSEDAKAVAARVGLAKPAAESPECLKCHVTGYDLATGKTPDKIVPADGVQCESCHGSGTAHVPEGKKFKAGDKTVKPGEKITRPDVKTCEKCHNDQSPTWRADRYTLADGTKVGFDYSQAWAKIQHNNPLKAKK